MKHELVLLPKNEFQDMSLMFQELATLEMDILKKLLLNVPFTKRTMRMRHIKNQFIVLSQYIKPNIIMKSTNGFMSDLSKQKEIIIHHIGAKQN